MKAPYVLKILEAKLIKEEQDLLQWRDWVHSGDYYKWRMAEGNIPSALIRITELKLVIYTINNIKEQNNDKFKRYTYDHTLPLDI